MEARHDGDPAPRASWSTQIQYRALSACCWLWVGHYGARPHCGELLRLGTGAMELNELIPGLREFRDECERIDPREAFASEFTKRVLGF